MKRFLLILICAILSLGASAQDAKRLIDLDPTSFRPVQTDVLKGVPIDKIGLDNSKRPCARVKIHINRMSREDIDRLEVKVVGGNVQLTRKVTAYEGNGLVIELTAKPQTRFYLHHDKFGDSNEVSLNLEGDKEYQLEGQLNLLLPVTVATNVVGAEVYFDKTYQGTTDENGFKTITEVAPGKHSILIVHENYAAKQDVEVNNDNISFRLTISNNSAIADATASSSSDVTTPLITPKATLKVGDYYNDGKKEGVIFWIDETGKYGRIVSLNEGSHLAWSRISKPIGSNSEYDGAKNMAVVKQISNWQEEYPAFKWCADLGEGWYLPSIKELEMFTLDDSVYNAVNRTLAIKGKMLGSTQYYYRLWSSTESGYNDSYTYAKIVYINSSEIARTRTTYDEDVRAVAIVNLSECLPETATPSSLSLIPSSTKTYRIGDYYNDGKKEGVVFWVNESGTHGKIVSLSESKLPWTVDEYAKKHHIATDSRSDGTNNMAVIKQIENWQTKFPVFKWCSDLGEDWYLPAIDELKSFIIDRSVRNLVNRTLADKGISLLRTGDDCTYFSSTSTGKSRHCADVVKCFGFFHSTITSKEKTCYIRAVAAF